jgi:hypothetical protein
MGATGSAFGIFIGCFCERKNYRENFLFSVVVKVTHQRWFFFNRLWSVEYVDDVADLIAAACYY